MRRILELPIGVVDLHCHLLKNKFVWLKGPQLLLGCEEGEFLISPIACLNVGLFLLLLSKLELEGLPLPPVTLENRLTACAQVAIPRLMDMAFSYSSKQVLFRKFLGLQSLAACNDGAKVTLENISDSKEQLHSLLDS